jgi:hypothetical protein
MLILSCVLLLGAVFIAPAFSTDWEFGISWTPVLGEDTGRAEEEGLESITGFHFAYSPWAILYASWDSLIMPAQVISDMTGYYDEENDVWKEGYYFPGYLNLFDVGIRLVLGPVLVSAQIGTNNIWVYREGITGGFGANLRLGAGLKFGWWGITLTGTSVFQSMTKLLNTFKGLASETTRAWAVNELTAGLHPSVMAVLHF